MRGWWSVWTLWLVGTVWLLMWGTPWRSYSARLGSTLIGG